MKQKIQSIRNELINYILQSVSQLIIFFIMFYRPKATLPVCFKPANECIYCGETNLELSDEHIIPYSLDGAWVYPQASCKACEKITSKFELTIAREMYLTLRTKHKFQSRRPKRRPKFFSAVLKKFDGSEEEINIEASKYPSFYPVLHLPPPGILTGQELSESSPEGMKLTIMGTPEEVYTLNREYPNGQIIFRYGGIYWSDFYRLLAKIAHGLTIAHLGKIGFIQLLPPLILGKCQHFSHFVGGDIVKTESDPKIIEIGDGYEIYMESGHIIVNIIMLNGRCPTYKVVSGYITDFFSLMTNVSHKRQENGKEFTHGIRTRFMFIHEWVNWFVKCIRHIVNKTWPNLILDWPLLNGYSFVAYAIPQSYYLVVLKNSLSPIPEGPDIAINLPFSDYPDLPPKISEIGLWDNWCRTKLDLSCDHWPILLPIHDSGKQLNVDGDFNMFSKDEKEFWFAQLNYLLNTQKVSVLSAQKQY